MKSLLVTFSNSPSSYQKDLSQIIEVVIENSQLAMIYSLPLVFLYYLATFSGESPI